MAPATVRRELHALVAAANHAVWMKRAIAGINVELPPERRLGVDDDTLLTDLVSRQLARAGHQVETHSDPLQALRRLSDGGPPFDVLVVDHNMPQMSGLDLADAARRLQPGMPVILTSAVVTDHLQASAAGRGIARVVEKSGSVQQLVDTIDGLTSGP